MKKKHIYIIINTFFLILLTYINNQVYSVYPNKFIAIFFPVNDSIFEISKSIFITYFIYIIPSMFLLRKLNLPYKNIFTTTLVKTCSTRILFNIMYFMFSSINIYILIFIAYLFIEYITYPLLSKYNKHIEIAALIIYITLFILIGTLTFHPMNHEYFKSSRNTYGYFKYTF